VQIDTKRLLSRTAIHLDDNNQHATAEISRTSDNVRTPIAAVPDSPNSLEKNFTHAVRLAEKIPRALRIADTLSAR
jgi:hypothetical protein